MRRTSDPGPEPGPPAPAPGATGAAGHTRSARLDWRILAVSIVLQLALATLFGPSYDSRVFMAAGYQVAGGHDPYVAQDLRAVFHDVGFHMNHSVGYPPPWPLFAGLVYRATYALIPSILLYDLALKLPVIAATVALAYLVAAILQRQGAEAATIRRAWVFVLLNPFLLYAGAAWGQIDVIVTLFSVAALYLLWLGRWDASALLLALAVCMKPIAAPLLLVVLAYVIGRSGLRAARYAGLFALGVVVLYALPFPLFGWDASHVLSQANAQFEMTGTLSFMTVARLIRDPVVLQGHWWLLGLLWILALAIALLALRRGVGELPDLVKKSLALVLVFFLTRTWLAEPNVVLVVPLALVLASLGELDRRALTALWTVPLAFTLCNAAVLQRLAEAMPWIAAGSPSAAAQYGDVALVVRAALVIAWQVTGWWVVIRCLRAGTARDRAARAATQGTTA